MSVIKLVIFDAGGVLYSGNQKIVDKAVRKFLENHGVHDFDKSEKAWSRIEKLVSVGRMSLREAHERWLEEVGLSRDLADEWKEINKNEIWGRFRRKPSLNKLLKDLRKKYVLAVLSDTIENKQEKIEKLKIIGVDHTVFDDIFTSHDLGVCKPSRRAFCTVLRRFGVKPREAVFVGDSCDELFGAKRIGLVAVGFDCVGGDYKIEKLDEVQGILENLEPNKSVC